MKGYDIDGVLGPGGLVTPNLTGCVVISGRTFQEYDDTCKSLAKLCPVYIRGVGNYGDVIAAGMFKAAMIQYLGVTEFYEDDDTQIAIIRQYNPSIIVHKVEKDKSEAK